ncbi:MAG: PepSY domain-containing protein [Oscillospiraceae bacterium]|nr:PepSY domain-containing protein [Oscillospiraceae bacterium]
MKKNALYCFLLTSVIMLSGCAARSESDLPDAALDGTGGSSAELNSTDTLSQQSIGLDDALNIALKHAGLDKDQIVLVRSKLELDGGIREYEIEFTADSHEYEYSVNAVSGEIIKFSMENISLPSESGSNSESVSSSDSQQDPERITEAQAKDIALKHAGISASAVTFTKSKLELDNGIWEYEIEFIANSREYEYTINAVSGTIISFESESIPQQSDSGSNSQQGSERITEAQAKDIALRHAGVSSSAVTFTKSKLELDNGIWEYEIEFFAGGSEFEYKLNAVTGAVLEWEMDGYSHHCGDSHCTHYPSSYHHGDDHHWDGHH